MTRRLSTLFHTCWLLLLCVASTLHAETVDKLQLSGFARVILGYLDDENAEYVGYDNSISANQQSLLGLQAEYLFNDEWSVTGQVVGFTGDQRNSGLEWLYI